MTTKKIFFSIAIACAILIGCKKNKEVKKELKIEKVALAISGMTCEIGCAKIIQSKLSINTALTPMTLWNASRSFATSSKHL